MASGQIKNEDFIFIEPHFGKWAMVARKLLPELQISGQVKNTEDKPANLKLLINQVLEPKISSTEFFLPIPQTIMTNGLEALLAINLVKAQVFAFNKLLMEHCWILFGFILNKDSRVPIVIVYFTNIEKAIYCIHKTTSEIKCQQICGQIN